MPMLMQVLAENDTFCLLPRSMRCVCLFLTILLLTSLATAIGNSMQTSRILSASHCKENVTDPGVGVLCPKESTFTYYVCCDSSSIRKCCLRLKLWLL
uniref:WAP domain-containing protein n=1 Tax=Syphacia muris TaxID=451379 RepID=A0A0N5AVE1_9BILA